VSLMTRNQALGVRERAKRTAQRAVPAAKNAVPAARQAVPIAKSAGETIRQTAEDAAAWAKPRADDVAAWARPHVDDARSWAAPRLERSGHAVQETIAPVISEAMISAARRIDVQQGRRKRGWARMVATVMIVAGAAAAAAAVVLRRQPVEPGFAVEPGPDEMRSPTDQPDGQTLAEANGSQPETEVSDRPQQP
jgi:hypothetical protein